MNELVIDSQLPSLNQYIDACRYNRYAGAEFKKSIESVIGWSIRQALTKKTLHAIDKPCVLYIEWHEATKRRDVDNIQSAQKYILDSLQHFGIIKNDSRRYVRQIRHEIIDDTKDYVRVIIDDTM